MTDRRKAILRSIMNMAWASRRPEVIRTFAACLRGAWAFSKKMAKAARKLMSAAKSNGGHIRFSYDLTRSPTKRKLIGQPWAAQRAYEACYGIASVGR